MVGAEIRTARLIKGMSIGSASAAAGMSSSQGSRIERGELVTVSQDQLARLGAVVELDVRTRSYPGPDASLDGSQLGLIGRLRGRVPATNPIRTEVPLPIPGDQRAWDGMILGLAGGPDTRLPFDADTHLVDLQAQSRRLTLKLRDAGIEHVLWLIARTRHNREVLDAGAASLAADFPISARRALAALAEGRHPGGSSIVLL